MKHHPTNTNTYFFREAAAIEVIRDQVLMPATQGGQVAAVWCVGCASGEEVYSLAIAAVEARLGAELLGTDINSEALREAEAAEYPARRLRYVTPALRERFFAPAGANFVVAAAPRRLVGFAGHDVTSDVTPRPRQGALRKGSWDAILCRNVFLYFDAEQVRRAVQSMVVSLAPGGLLVLGAAERLGREQLQPVSGAHLVVEKFGDAFLYRRADRPGGSRRRRDTAPKLAPGSVAPVQAAEVGQASALCAEGDRLLLAGQAGEALNSFERASQAAPLDAQLHLRVGSCLLVIDRRQEARASLRRALFLDPLLWQAALLLGEVCRGEDDAATRRYLQQARDGLQRGAQLSLEAVEAAILGLAGADRATAPQAIVERLQDLSRKRK